MNCMTAVRRRFISDGEGLKINFNFLSSLVRSKLFLREEYFPALRALRSMAPKSDSAEGNHMHTTICK